MRHYFKGWYFKAQNDSGAVAFIPAMHIDGAGNKSASIQIITDQDAWCAWYPYEQFSCRGNRLSVTIGGNTFREQGLEVDIQTQAFAVSGRLTFGPLWPIRYDIMGPFRYVPFMECRHSVFSLTHAVNGCLTINGEPYRFEQGVGYIEGDRGCSFPTAYVWTQCNFIDQRRGCIMLSAAEIPLGPGRFTGVTGVILWRGKEYRLATYLGAKAVRIRDGGIVVKQGRFSLTAKRLSKQDRSLYAPVGGGMARFIRESLSCTVSYLFQENGKTLFEFETDRASFEYEYDESADGVAGV